VIVLVRLVGVLFDTSYCSRVLLRNGILSHCSRKVNYHCSFVGAEIKSLLTVPYSWFSHAKHEITRGFILAGVGNETGQLFSITATGRNIVISYGRVEVKNEKPLPPTLVLTVYVSRGYVRARALVLASTGLLYCFAIFFRIRRKQTNRSVILFV